MDIIKKKKYKRWFYSTPTIIIFVILILLVGRATWGIFQKEQETQKKLSLTQKEYAELKERQKNLKKELDRLETRQGVEKEIREKFGVAKKGEEVIYVVERENNKDGESATSSRSWWKKALSFFGLF